MNAGVLRHRVTIRTVTLADNPMGGSTETATDITGIPARVEPLSGGELIQAMQTGMKRPHRFTIRYRTGITGAKTIIYDGRTFDIQSPVDPEERHRKLIILAEEINA